MRSSSHDRMISCSPLLVDLHIPKKTLSYNGWAMEQLTLLQNQSPVEEVKIDIMFKFKLCIYYIYKTLAYCDYIKKYIGWSIWLPVCKKYLLGIGWWTTFVNIKLCFSNSAMLTKIPDVNRKKESQFTILKNLYAHNILFRNAKKKYQQLCEILLRTLECAKTPHIQSRECRIRSRECRM